MPAFKFNKSSIYYAGTKKHLGFYPGSSDVIVIFKEELKPYRTTKGSNHFLMMNLYLHH